MLASIHISVGDLKLEGSMPSSLPQCEPAFTWTPTAWLFWNPNSRDGSSLKISAAILAPPDLKLKYAVPHRLYSLVLYDSLNEQRLF